MYQDLDIYVAWICQNPNAYRLVEARELAKISLSLWFIITYFDRQCAIRCIIYNMILQ